MAEERVSEGNRNYFAIGHKKRRTEKGTGILSLDNLPRGCRSRQIAAAVYASHQSVRESPQELPL